MSTSVWTKVVGLRHCSAPGTVAALVSAGPSQSGARTSRSSPKWPTASLCVGDHHVAQLPAGLGVQRLELAEVVEPADQAAVDVGPVVVQHLLLPLAHVGGADPERPVDPGVQQALGAAVGEGVLAGPGAEALPEQHHARPLLRGSFSSGRCGWRRPASGTAGVPRPPGPGTAGRAAGSTAWSPRRCCRGSGRRRSPRPRSSRTRCRWGRSPSAAPGRRRRCAPARPGPGRAARSRWGRSPARRTPGWARPPPVRP